MIFMKECFRGLTYLICSLMTLAQKICAKNKVIDVCAGKSWAFFKKYLTAVTLKHVVIQNGLEVCKKMKITRISATNDTLTVNMTSWRFLQIWCISSKEGKYWFCCMRGWYIWISGVLWCMSCYLLAGKMSARWDGCSWARQGWATRKLQSLACFVY